MIQDMKLSESLTASQMAKTAGYNVRKRSIINISSNILRFGSVKSTLLGMGKFLLLWQNALPSWSLSGASILYFAIDPGILPRERINMIHAVPP
jgi:hypothetical protein